MQAPISSSANWRYTYDLSTLWGVKTVSWALTWPFMLLVRIR